MTVMTMVRTSSSSPENPNPFRQAYPPPNETPEEKHKREIDQKISDQIDEELKAEKAMLRKRDKGIVKVLLLGQSESGKSTTLKNFRMTYARDEWEKERASWRAVVQLNLVQSVLTILETVVEYMDARSPYTSPSTSPVNMIPSSASTTSASRPKTADSGKHKDEELHFTDRHKILNMRLSPLRSVAVDLKRALGAGTMEITSMTSEHYLGATQWNNIMHNHEIEQMKEMADVRDVITGCREDMMTLWNDELVRRLLKIRNVDMAVGSGFFLDDLERIATINYQPSDDDIVRARLRTLGVQEYRIIFDKGSSGNDHGKEWLLYDVGGSRTIRRAWIPYFENINAIIFSVSCFDETLREDHTVNRLEDTFQIWKVIVRSTLLSQTSFVVFLNKCDLLKRKLHRGGVEFKKYCPDYGNQPNEPQAVLKYLRTKFKEVVKKDSPVERTIYLYPTSVTDTKATAVTLKTVRDSILRGYLKAAEFV